MKILKFFLISLVCVVLVTSAGFSMWMFVSYGDEPPQIRSGQVTVDTMETKTVAVDIFPPSAQGFLNYNISIQYGNENTRSDLSKDVCFMPFIGFNVKNYALLAQNENLYYYFTFSSTSSIFASSQNENGYIYFDTNRAGQSEHTKIKMNVRDGLGDFIYLKDDLGEPVLDENNNLIYQMEFSFTPIFKYKSGRKPATVDEYKNLLNLINNSTGENKLTLHVVSE